MKLYIITRWYQKSHFDSVTLSYACSIQFTLKPTGYGPLSADCNSL